MFPFLSFWHFWLYIFVNMCSRALDSSIPLPVILAQSSCGAVLQLFNLVWNLAIRTPLRGPSTVSPHGNHCTNSQQAQPFPMIMNESVRRVSLHLSETLWWLRKPQKCEEWHRLDPGSCSLSLSRCIGSLRYRAKRGLSCPTLSDMSSWAQR